MDVLVPHDILNYIFESTFDVVKNRHRKIKTYIFHSTLYVSVGPNYGP